MSNIVIGIEGLVGSGKTSICRELLKIIPNSIVFHGGNLYRGIVYSLINSNKKISNNMNTFKENIQDIDIKKIMDMLNVELKIENREPVVYVNNEKIDEEKLQSKDASMAVSIAGGSADNSKLFIFAHDLIEKYKQNYNVILSGRALNTIYPELDYHFFITASIDERVKRKAIQYGQNINLEELKQHIIERDRLQQNAGFYNLARNSIEIDVTDCINANESAQKVYKYISEINRTTLVT